MQSENNLNQYDENTRHAIELRLARQKHSDFYVKLCLLSDRIQVYKYLFMEKTPKYLMKRTIQEQEQPKRRKSVSKASLSRRRTQLFSLAKITASRSYDNEGNSRLPSMSLSKQ